MNGETCTVLGNPICRDLAGPDTPPPPPPMEPADPTPGTTAPAMPPATAPTLSPTFRQTIADTDVPTATALDTDSPTVGLSTLVPIVTDPPTPSPTLVTECGVNEIQAVSGEAVIIPPCIDNAERVSVKTWPQNGTLNIRENKSVVYVPNSNFVGNDSIVLENCDADGTCYDVTINMVVVEPVEVESKDSGDGGGNAALAALAVIPIVAVALGYFIYRKHQQKPAGPSNINEGGADASDDGFTFNDPSSGVPVQQSGGGGGGRKRLPTVKDQAQSVSAATASLQSDSGLQQGSNTASRPRRADPPAAATATPVANKAAASDDQLPSVKDQCRPAAAETNNDPPMAAAVLVETVNSEEDVQHLEL